MRSVTLIWKTDFNLSTERIRYLIMSTMREEIEIEKLLKKFEKILVSLSH